MTRRRWLPELAIATVVLIWSTSWIAIKDALSVIRPLPFMSSRFVLIAALACGVIAIRQGRLGSVRIERRDCARLVAGSLIRYSAYQLSAVFALDRSSVFTISLVFALVPLCTILMMFTMGEALPP